MVEEEVDFGPSQKFFPWTDEGREVPRDTGVLFRFEEWCQMTQEEWTGTGEETEEGTLR